jgi:PPOX class probable F420-dependent enzyme
MTNLTDKQAKLFSDPNYGWAVTLRRDGTPHATVVWIDYDGESVLFNTAKPRAKWRHLERDPRVTVAVVDPQDPFNRAAVTGPAELVWEGADEHIHKLSRKYNGRDYDGFKPEETRVIVRVTPEQVVDS